jgi:hypothetical protein
MAKYFRESWLVIINYKILSKFQAGFIKGKRTTDNVFVIKTTIDKYLRFKRGSLYWCFVDFEKAFDSIHRGALWYKLKIKGICNNMVKCIREIYDGIKICVKCGDDEVTDFIEQKRGVSPYLFNIFIDDIIDYITKDNPHAPVVGTTTIPGLLFADDLAFASFTINGLQKAVDQVTRYSREWSLNKIKIVVFKK